MADGIFKWIFLNENDWIPIQISLKFVPESQIKPALIQIMAGRRQGDKPLSKPTMVILLMYIYALLGFNELTKNVPPLSEIGSTQNHETGCAP